MLVTVARVFVFSLSVPEKFSFASKPSRKRKTTEKSRKNAHHVSANFSGFFVISKITRFVDRVISIIHIPLGRIRFCKKFIISIYMFSGYLFVEEEVLFMVLTV